MTAVRHVTDREVAAIFPLVDAILRTMRAKGQIVPTLDLEDLTAVGRAAAWKALTRIEDGRHPREIDVFLWGAISGGILDYQRTAARAQGYHRRLGQIAAIGSFDDPIPDTENVTIGETLVAEDDVEQQAENTARLDRAHKVARTLTGRKRAVADWLLAGEPVTARALADQIGVTESRVSQILATVRRDLAHAPIEQTGTLLVDRETHPTEHDAIRECGRVRPGAEIMAMSKRKVRHNRVVMPQGRSGVDGSVGRSVWAIELREAS